MKFIQIFAVSLALTFTSVTAIQAQELMVDLTNTKIAGPDLGFLGTESKSVVIHRTVASPLKVKLAFTYSYPKTVCSALKDTTATNGACLSSHYMTGEGFPSQCDYDTKECVEHKVQLVSRTEEINLDFTEVCRLHVGEEELMTLTFKLQKNNRLEANLIVNSVVYYNIEKKGRLGFKLKNH